MQRKRHKIQTVLYASKMIMIVFWDHQGPIDWKFEDDVKSRVSKDTYFDTLNNLQNAIKCKRPSLLSRKLCLLHDNNILQYTFPFILTPFS